MGHLNQVDEDLARERKKAERFSHRLGHPNIREPGALKGARPAAGIIYLGSPPIATQKGGL